MAETLHQEPEFWLPAEFLTDEDIVLDNNKENCTRATNPSHFCFNSHLPFDFDRVHSSSDVDAQLAELTRQLTLQKSLRMTTPHQNYKGSHYGNLGSPQSTLFQFGGSSRRSPDSSNDGSPNGPSQVSSPTSHFTPETNSLDLIYQAATQVAKLKINNSQQTHSNSSALYTSFVQRVREEQLLKSQQQRRNGLIFKHENRSSGLNVGACLENHESAWPSLQYMMHQNLQKRAGNVGAFSNHGSGNGYFNSVRKSPSTGTGVFLPRCYENSGVQTKTNRKSDCSNAFLHGRDAQASQTQWQRRSHGPCSAYSEIQLAQKHAMLMHQRRTHQQQQVELGHEFGLPQEWTY